VFTDGRLDGGDGLVGRSGRRVGERPDAFGGRNRLPKRESTAGGQEPRLCERVGRERPPLGVGVVDEHRSPAEHVTDEHVVTQPGEAGGAGQRRRVGQRRPDRRLGRAVE